MENSKYMLDALRRTCANGSPSLNRVNSLLREKPGSYTISELKFLEKYLFKRYPTNLRTAVLKVLCKFGNPVSNYVEELSDSVKMKSEVIKIAEEQNDPDTILSLTDEGSMTINLGISALKRMGKTEYLTSFLFSDNEDLVNLVKNLE